MPNVFRILSCSTIYQEWDGFPASPVDIREYPYQFIADGSLWVFNGPVWRLWYSGSWTYQSAGSHYIAYHILSGSSSWSKQAEGDVSTSIYIFGVEPPDQCNTDIFDDATMSSVQYPMTIPHPPESETRQKWDMYPDSPVLTINAPYQALAIVYGYVALVASQTKLYWNSGALFAHNGDMQIYLLLGGAWHYYQTTSATFLSSFDDGQANQDVYTSSELTDVAFPKTTTQQQDGDPYLVKMAVGVR